MLVSIFYRGAARTALWLGFVVLLAGASWAQDDATPAAQTTPPAAQTSAPAADANAPATQANPPAKQSSVTPMTPYPQAPAPQHNAHLYSGDQNYAKPLSPLPNLIAPYTRRHVPPANLTNSPTTDTLFHDGQIFLSINEAVAMALENNLDITLQRYNLSIADTDLLLTSTGAAARGVNTNVVQGTQGGALGAVSAGGTGSSTTGASGTGAGGTQVGVGGAGAGGAGLVLSTLGFGPTIDNFDPTIGGALQGERAVTPQQSTIFYGVPSLNQNTNTYNFNYSQGFSTGTLMTLTFNNSYITTNSPFSFVNPQLTPSLPLPVAPASAAGVWLRSQPALDPHCTQQPRDCRCGLPPADHHHRLAD